MIIRPERIFFSELTFWCFFNGTTLKCVLVLYSFLWVCMCGCDICIWKIRIIHNRFSSNDFWGQLRIVNFKMFLYWNFESQSLKVSQSLFFGHRLIFIRKTLMMFIHSREKAAVGPVSYQYYHQRGRCGYEKGKNLRIQRTLFNI